jgi:plastocyanin
MKPVRWNAIPGFFVLSMLFLGMFIVPQSATAAQTWQADVGAASRDQGLQAMAFLPNELWIHAGDSVTWTSRTDEGHTVTFLKPGQTRPPFPDGCPGVTPSGSDFTGATCVNSGPFVGGPYSVKFPNPGNFKLVCLIHQDMTGVVHVLKLSETLPHNQAFYDDLAENQARVLISDTDRITDDDHPGRSHRFWNSRNSVVVTGETVATGGGKSFLAVMRFLPETIHVHVGETVEWTSFHPSEPHTVTFGTEPPNPLAPFAVTADSDGALHGTLPNAATNNSVSSGLFGPSPQELVGLPQMPLGVTRVRVTFTQPGTYDYICAIHDELGMKGKVIVVPKVK